MAMFYYLIQRIIKFILFYYQIIAQIFVFILTNIFSLVIIILDKDFNNKMEG